jgi:hypothetical protein
MSKSKIIFTLSLIVFYFYNSLFTNVYAQSIELAPEVSFGRSFNLRNLFDKTFDQNSNIQVGLVLSYQPKDSLLFSLIIGTSFDRKGDEHASINSIRFPLGIEKQFGRKVQAVFGCGFYISYITSSNIPTRVEPYNRITDVQFGGYFHVGLAVSLTKYIVGFIALQSEYDYTPLYKEKQVNHSGNVSYSNYRVLSYLLSVGIKYRFQTKNKSSKYAVIKE